MTVADVDRPDDGRQTHYKPTILAGFDWNKEPSLMERLTISADRCPV